MVQLGMSLSEAMMRLRAYAFVENRGIVNRRLTLELGAT